MPMQPMGTGKKIYAMDVILEELEFHRVECAHFDKRFFLSFVIHLSPENLKSVARRYRGWAERLDSIAACLERGSVTDEEAAVLARTSGGGGGSNDYSIARHHGTKALPESIPKSLPKSSGTEDPE